MPFLLSPTPFHAKNNKSSLRKPHFFSETIAKLLNSDYIEELGQGPYCCNPLTVAEKKKLRLVLDLRHVNKFIKYNEFHYENLNRLSEMKSANDFFTTFDLKSGYHHIEIHP